MSGGSRDEQSAALQHAAAGEWAAWLSQFAWHHAATLTTRRSVSPQRLRRDFAQWVRRVERVTQRPVRWFYAIEEGAPGWPHLHGLLSGTAGVSTPQLRALWPHGWTVVATYDGARGATGYFTKGMLARQLEPDRYDISRQLPPPRRRGAPPAQFAPSAFVGRAQSCKTA